MDIFLLSSGIMAPPCSDAISCSTIRDSFSNPTSFSMHPKDICRCQWNSGCMECHWANVYHAKHWSKMHFLLDFLDMSKTLSNSVVMQEVSNI